ncbi:hypothetical protein PHYPO_G00176890 [Pangasianodon hypophthalmus]|uniref:Uncharacterized protein n=1 Tax=Pangasianodon hypophthalmus TaxID=310915 RepID=A0A5N5PRK7_PANHP|nr:hypothetical protein PHYPO_G00176890 [Pangasianodon hypophthalmus]
MNDTLTDTEEEGESEEDRKVVEPLDELTVLLQRADRLHDCNSAEKKKACPLCWRGRKSMIRSGSTCGG